jgi:carbonic anhydrase
MFCSCLGKQAPSSENDFQVDPSEGFGPSKLGVRTTVDEPLSASQAIEVLQAGNRRFVQGDAKAGGFDQRARRALASHGQRPVATVIGCADSRCPVEQLFDARPGDIFVLRNAGNTCTHAEGSMVGSVEYSVAVLETKMILVLGHTGCGAIMGATKLFLERSAQKHIEATCQKDAQETTDQSTEGSESDKSRSTLLGLLDALVPVAEQACVQLGAGSSTEEIAAHAVKVNVWRTINFLLSYSLIIREKVASGEVELQGAIYNMSSGAVDFLGKSPKQAQLLNYDGHVVPSMGGPVRQVS